jgi:hypothetical protein
LICLLTPSDKWLAASRQEVRATMLSDIPDAVAALRAAVERVAAIDPTSLPDPSLLVGLEELYDVETMLRAAQTRWLGVADGRELTVHYAGRASRSWLIEERNLGGRDAAARLRLARTLPAFPTVAAAFADARVTADQAAAIVAGLLDVPTELRSQVEERLVTRADELSPFGLTRAIDQLLGELDVQTGKDRAEGARQRRLGRRGVDLDTTFEGTGSLAGTLSPEVHDALKLALDAIDPASARGDEDDRTPRQRRHDALGALARYYLDSAETVPAVNGERPRVVLTINAADLLGSRPAWSRLDSGLPVPPDSTQRLVCDAQIVPVVIAGDGDVLRLGRTTRVWSAAQRRAAWIRDEGRCVFPKCRRPPVDLHHMVWWSSGGATDLENAAWLCAFHHWLVHEAGWTLRRHDERGYVFTAPHREHISKDPPPRRPRVA